MKGLKRICKTCRSYRSVVPMPKCTLNPVHVEVHTENHYCDQHKWHPKVSCDIMEAMLKEEGGTS